MDFSSVGTTERVSDAFRAHVNLRINGQQRNAYGPRRPDEAAAKEDLESMRAAASGMSREDGFAAMKVEADQLKAGKPPKEVGFIDRDVNGFRAQVKYKDAGALRHTSLGRGGQTRKPQRRTLSPFAPQPAAWPVKTDLPP